jgi:hypothetical protein
MAFRDAMSGGGLALGIVSVRLYVSIDAAFVGRIWDASAKTAQSAESQKSCKTATHDICSIPANSEKSRDGKEGVAGSSPAEGSEKLRYDAVFVFQERLG